MKANNENYILPIERGFTYFLKDNIWLILALLSIASIIILLMGLFVIFSKLPTIGFVLFVSVLSTLVFMIYKKWKGKRDEERIIFEIVKKYNERKNEIEEGISVIEEQSKFLSHLKASLGMLNEIPKDLYISRAMAEIERTRVIMEITSSTLNKTVGNIINMQFDFKKLLPLTSKYFHDLFKELEKEKVADRNPENNK